MDTNLRVRHSAESPKPSEAEVVSAILEIENATQKASAAGGSLPEAQAAPPSLVLSLKMLLLCFVLVMMVASLLAWGVYRMAKGFLLPVAGRGSVDGTRALHLATDAMKQAEAELLLARVAAGDSGAASQVLEQSASWTGKTESTPKTDQFITTSLNLHDLKSRGAALEAQLALNGIPRDASGFATLEQDAGNPQHRAYAMWMLGALGNRGVEAERATKIIEAYLTDPDVTVRSNAVIGLALLGTDETIPMLLDRFRNDPAVAVQELAGCGLSESGMYSPEQRRRAAGTLVGWLDDSLLSPQQRTWVTQALQDISGRNFGANSAAWQDWYESTR